MLAALATSHTDQSVPRLVCILVVQLQLGDNKSMKPKDFKEEFVIQVLRQGGVP